MRRILHLGFLAAGMILGGSLLSVAPLSGSRTVLESGTFSIFFAQEKVGYEEFEWREEEAGFVLTVRGRMNKPVPLAFSELVIKVDRSFIPRYFRFVGSVSGISQEVESLIDEGKVENLLRFADQEQSMMVNIRRDAFLLPNPIFAPYMILTKKFRCLSSDAAEIMAYIIPQMELPGLLEPAPDFPCTLALTVSGNRVELDTDGSGRLLELRIPGQNLKVTRD